MAASTPTVPTTEAQWRAAYALGHERDVPVHRPSAACRSSRSTPRPTCRTPGEIGVPGDYPFTRGVYPSMYRGRLWTMRQFAGFGTSEETNERFRYLLDHGQTGLSTAFDMPSLMGHDSDHARSLGEVGREGVAVDTLDDMQTLFARHRPRRGLGLDDDQRARGDHARLLRRRRRGASGVPAERAGRHDPGRHPQGVHRPEGVVLPDRPGDAPVRRHDRVVHRGHMPRWHPDLDLRLPHPRGRLDRRSRSSPSRSRTASPTSSRPSSAASTSTTSRRGCRSSSTPRSTSSRRSPSTAPRGASGRASCARPSARKNPRSWLMRFHTQTAGRLADRPAAAQQHRAHRDRGARRRARRHAVAAHQLLRRGARAADRGGRAHRAAHAADHRPRDRRRRTPSTRSAAPTSSRR